jgi:hypothetical protein
MPVDCVPKIDVRSRRVARASGALSRDVLRGILRYDAKRTLDCAMPAPGNGHTHEGHSHAAFNGEDPAYRAAIKRSTA